MADVWTLTLQRSGVGANWELFKLFKADFLGSYWYWAQDTLFFAKIDGTITKH